MEFADASVDLPVAMDCGLYGVYRGHITALDAELKLVKVDWESDRFEEGWTNPDYLVMAQ